MAITEELRIILQNLGFDTIILNGDNINSKIFLDTNSKRIIKISIKNPATKSLLNEYNILSHLNTNFTPKVYSYNKIAYNKYEYIEYIEKDFIDGEILDKYNYFLEFDRELYKCLKVLYENNIILGDIKPDNIIIKDKKIFLFDFDQGYFHNNIIEAFDVSPDMLGNIYEPNKHMNYYNLLKKMKGF